MANYWIDSVLILVIWAMIARDMWKDHTHNQIVRDLTSKIMAEDLNEYRTVMEYSPPGRQRKEVDKNKKPTDAVLGDVY